MLAVLASGSFAVGLAAPSPAFAAGSVWLNWVNVDANHQPYGAYQTTIHQVQTEVRTYGSGCSNMRTSGGGQFFYYWYCGAAGTGNGLTPYSNCNDCYAWAWNDSSHNQLLWSWEEYN